MPPVIRNVLAEPQLCSLPSLACSFVRDSLERIPYERAGERREATKLWLRQNVPDHERHFVKQHEVQSPRAAKLFGSTQEASRRTVRDTNTVPRRTIRGAKGRKHRALQEVGGLL